MSIRLKDTILENINSADKLTSSAGGTTQPIYFLNGKPTNCSYTLGKSVPADAKFTDTNTTYSQATPDILGLVKIGYSANDKNYPVQLNSEGKMYVNVPWTDTDTNTDTKNTAGSTDSSSKLFLIGATSQAANPQTYSHNTAYVGTDGCLYSNSTKVSVEGHTHSYAGSSSAGGSANSAIKLSNSRTIWGQSFNGTANISGNLNASGSTISADFFDITRYGTENLTKASIFSGNNDGTNYGLIFEAAQSTEGALMPIFIGWRGGTRAICIQNTNTTIKGRVGIGQYTSGTILIDAFNGIGRIGCDDVGANDTDNPKGAYISMKFSNGYVGVGTLSATSKLHVEGTVTATAVRGDSTSNNLTFRHLDGQNCNDDYNLYLQYHNQSWKTYFNGTTYYIDGANYNGTAAKANKLSTARTISLTGSVTGSGSFDGSGNLSIATSTNHTHSYLPLSGGVMTDGNISWNTDSHGVYFYNGCGIEKWSGYGPSLVAETGTDFHISSKSNRATRYLILHTGNWQNYINVSTSSTNSARFYNITAIGSGTYNIGQIFNGDNGGTTYGFAVEAALASDSSSAAKLPMFFGWRGGKIGAKLSEGNFDIYYNPNDFSGLNFWRSNNTCFHLSNRSSQNKFSIFYYDGSTYHEHGWVTSGGLFNLNALAIGGEQITFTT